KIGSGLECRGHRSGDERAEYPRVQSADAARHCPLTRCAHQRSGKCQVLTSKTQFNAEFKFKRDRARRASLDYFTTIGCALIAQRDAASAPPTEFDQVSFSCPSGGRRRAD